MHYEFRILATSDTEQLAPFTLSDATQLCIKQTTCTTHSILIHFSMSVSSSHLHISPWLQHTLYQHFVDTCHISLHILTAQTASFQTLCATLTMAAAVPAVGFIKRTSGNISYSSRSEGTRLYLQNPCVCVCNMRRAHRRKQRTFFLHSRNEEAVDA